MTHKEWVIEFQIMRDTLRTQLPVVLEDPYEFPTVAILCLAKNVVDIISWAVFELRSTNDN